MWTRKNQGFFGKGLTERTVVLTDQAARSLQSDLEQDYSRKGNDKFGRHFVDLSTVHYPGPSFNFRSGYRNGSISRGPKILADTDHKSTWWRIAKMAVQLEEQG